MPKFKLSSFKNKHFLALAGNGVISVITVLQMGLIYHKLEKSEVGAWVMFLTILGIAEALRNGFLQTATVKFYSGTTGERAREILGSVWFWALVTTGLVFLAISLVGNVGIMWAAGASLANGGIPAFGQYVYNDEIVRIINWIGVTYISSLPYTLIFWILMAEERYDKILWMRLVNSGSMILCIFVAVFCGRMSLDMLLWINFLTNMLTNVVGYFAGMAKLEAFPGRTKASIDEIYHFGKFSLGTNLISNLLRNTDNFIINFMIGPAALAVYNLPVKLMEIVEIPLRSFVGTGMTGMAAAYNAGDMGRVKYILTKYAGMLTIVFIPMAAGAFVIAGPAIYFLGGAKYTGSEAANIFRVCMFLAIFYPIDRFNGTTLDVIHKPNINFQKVIVMLVANTVCDFIGVSLFGNLYGILLGSVCTMASGLVFGYFKLRKFVPHTPLEVMQVGVAEMKSFLQQRLGFPRKPSP